MKKILLILLLLLPFCRAQADWIDQSTQLFFPEKEGQMFDLYQKMPATWWNFFFYDKKQLSQDEACELLSKINSTDILFSPCLALFVKKSWLSSWAESNLFNQAPPSDTDSLKLGLTKL